MWLYTNFELVSEVNQSETWALEIPRNLLATRFIIGLNILKGNNCSAFPAKILIGLHVFALLRKDGKPTRITSEFLYILQSRISTNWGNWWENISLTTIASTTAGMTAATLSLKTKWRDAATHLVRDSQI